MAAPPLDGPPIMLADSARLRRLHFRAWHRGTKEADILLGSFVDSRMDRLTPGDVEWLEQLLMEQDVDILTWVMGLAPCPEPLDGPLMAALRQLDYLPPVK